MSAFSLSVDMKASIALILAWMVFLVFGIVSTLASGQFDVYALSSLVLLVPYGALAFFARKRKSWPYLGSAILSVALLAIIPMTIGPTLSPLYAWETGFATLLFALIALESFKGYLGAKS